MNRVVVIGANAAGLAAARGLREFGFAAPIDLVDAEEAPHHVRPSLSKSYLVLSGQGPEFLAKASDLEALDIHLHWGHRCRRIDVLAKVAELENGERLCGTLVVATGAAAVKAPIPGVDLDGVHVLRSAADARRLAIELSQGRSLVIIGGGVIGAEVASIARNFGCDVTIVEAASEMMLRAFGTQAGAMLRERHIANGTLVLLGRRATHFRGSHKVEAVELDDGTRISADAVLIAMGARANDRLASEAGIACQDGILVDECGRSSAPDVWAAGDVARFKAGPFAGKRFEHQLSAEDQGRRVARSILGLEPEPLPLPYLWSEQLGLNIQMVGEVPAGSECVIRGNSDGNAFSLLYLLKDAPVAAIVVGLPRDLMTARRLISGRVSVTGEILRNTTIALADILKPAQVPPTRHAAK